MDRRSQWFCAVQCHRGNCAAPISQRQGLGIAATIRRSASARIRGTVNRSNATMKDDSMARRRFLSGLAAVQVAASQARGAATNPPKWKLVVGCDHAGFPMKGPVIQALQSWGHTVKDVGTFSADPVDFPDIAQKLCAEILAGRSQRGVMVCGTEIGRAACR